MTTCNHDNAAHGPPPDPASRFTSEPLEPLALLAPVHKFVRNFRHVENDAAESTPRLSHAAVAGPDIALADWEDLFSAVKDRLRQCAGALSERPLNGAADRAPFGVMECVSALDQLHLSLAHGLGRQRQLEREVHETRAALARAHADLAGTQAGELRARQRALHDCLTSLPNRTHFRQRLGAALSHTAPRRSTLAVLYLDLDGFKPINDAHGHDVGDELLRVVAMRLARSVRAADMVGRLGGDEFACLIADPMDRDRLQHMARKLFDAVSAPLQIGTLTFTVRPSVGIAIYPEDGSTVDALLKRADAAMYFAKRQRTGHAFFDACDDGAGPAT